MKKPIAIMLLCVAITNLNSSLLAQSTGSEPNISSIETMSLEQILAYIKNLPKNTELRNVITITERLYNIAYFDHHIDIRERNVAIKLLDPLKKDVEEVLKNNPVALEAYREANKLNDDRILYVGYGSLSWKIKENNISADQVISYMMRKDNGPLLKRFLETLEDKVKKDSMTALIKELIYSRQYEHIQNAVLILHGLAAQGDLATKAVFTDKDFTSLMRASSDYKNARDVLVKFKLLPTQSDAKPLFPKPADDILAAFILQSSDFRKDSGKWDESRELIELHNSLYGDHKEFLMVSVLLMRIHLWLYTIKDIYGDEAFRNIKKKVFAKFTQAKKHGIETWFGVIALAENMKIRNTLKTDLDTATALALMEISGIFPKDKETYKENKAFLTKVFRIINLERVYSLNRIRFYLRYLVGNYPKQSKEMERDIIDDFVKALLRGESDKVIMGQLYSSEDRIGIPR